MSKKTILILSLSLLLLGASLFIGGMTMLNWNFKALSTVKYETNEYTVTEEFSSIRIKTDTARVILVPSEDGRVSVVCHERKRSPHTVRVADGVLCIEVEKRKWYEQIGLDFDSPTVTVALPRTAYETLTVQASTGGIKIPSSLTFSSAELRTSTGSIETEASVTGHLTVKASTGSLRVRNLSASTLSLSVSTGRITVSDVTVSGNVSLTSSTGKVTLTGLRCQSLLAECDTGDALLEDVVASGRMEIETDTGDVRLTRCDAAEIDIETDTGSIVGSLLSEKLFDAKSGTGSVNAPLPSGVSPCKIRSDTGSIRISLAKK